MQKTPKAATALVMAIEIHHQRGALFSTIPAIRSEIHAIEWLFHTSGRLGILESAEMPPTFSTDPQLVQAIMAGGHKAIFNAKEGVEDNYEEGARSIMRLS